MFLWLSFGCFGGVFSAPWAHFGLCLTSRWASFGRLLTPLGPFGRPGAPVGFWGACMAPWATLWRPLDLLQIGHHFPSTCCVFSVVLFKIKPPLILQPCPYLPVLAYGSQQSRVRNAVAPCPHGPGARITVV